MAQFCVEGGGHAKPQKTPTFRSAPSQKWKRQFRPAGRKRVQRAKPTPDYPAIFRAKGIFCGASPSRMMHPHFSQKLRRHTLAVMPARLARSDSQTDLLRIAAAANQPIDTIARIGSPSPAIGPGAPRYCVGLFGFGAIANGGNAATAVSIVGASTVLIGAFIVPVTLLSTRSQNLHLQHWLSRYRDSDNVSVLQLMRFRTRGFASEPALRSRAPPELRRSHRR